MPCTARTDGRPCPEAATEQVAGMWLCARHAGIARQAFKAPPTTPPPSREQVQREVSRALAMFRRRGSP